MWSSPCALAAEWGLRACSKSSDSRPSVENGSTVALRVLVSPHTRLGAAMRNILLIAASVLLSAAAPPHHAASAGLRFVDLTDDFDRAWQATKYLPDDKRVPAFEARFAKALPGFYSAERVKDYKTPEQYRAWMLAGLKAYPQRRTAILQTSSKFQSMVAPARHEFE